MTAISADDALVAMSPRRQRIIKTIDVVGLIATLVTVLGAVIWAFPLYWGMITTLKVENDIVQPGIELWPRRFSIEAYTHVLFNTNIGTWYINSLATALAIIAFIGAWTNFLWPFLAVTKEQAMNVTVGITQVTDAFGVKYARDLGAAMLAGLPVAIMYLIFQRRVTQAIMLTAGIKG